MAPHQVTSKTVPEVWDKLYGQRFDQKTPPPKCQVGNRVRLNKKHRPFKKGYLPGWTEEVLWSRTYGVIPWSPIDSVNGTARL